MPEAWDIWWARWPNDDGTSKERFVLVLGATGDDYICVYISTRLHAAHPHIVLAEGHPDFAATGLREESYLYVRDYLGLPAEALVSYAGFLGDGWQAEVAEHLG